MQRLALAAMCLLFWASESARAGLGAGDVSTSLLLTRTRFLSTEKPSATLTIVNQTTGTVSFAPYSIEIFVRSDSGWEEQRHLLTVSHVIRGSPTQIAPSARFEMSLALPSCTVYSDPCYEDVLVRYTLDVDGSARAFQTLLPRYEFVPDPTATYDVPGLSGNRPTFIVPGVANDTIFPDTLLIEFTPSSSEAHPPFTTTPDLVGELAHALSKAGVQVGGNGFDTVGDTWKAQLYVSNASSQRDAIARALVQVQAQFRSRITSVDQHFVFDPRFDAQSIFAQAEEQAQRQARELAYMTGSGDIASEGSTPRLYLGHQTSGLQFPDLNNALPLDRQVLLDQTTATPTPIQAVVEGLFVGLEPARLSAYASVAKNAASGFRPPDSWFLPPLDPQASIAADRPELYETGTISMKAAFSTGLSPYLVAALHARARTRHLAQILRVQPGPESLFAIYPMGEDSDIRTLGLATTFSGGDARGWSAIRADPGVKAYRSDDSRQRAMVPIAVPDPNTTITEMAGAVAAQPPDALRLGVQLSYKAPPKTTAASVSAENVAARLKQLPYVMDVASGAAPESGWRYELLLRGADASELAHAFEAIRSAYVALDPSIEFRVDAVSLNCRQLEDRLLKASIRQDWLLAQSDALKTNRTIRKLLLVATFPIGDDQEECLARAELPTVFDHWWPGDVPEVPERVNMFPTSMMVFRTFPPKAPR
jgi:hypothetical protein